MLVLALESATELAGAAVADGDTVRATAWVTGRRAHAESLAPAVWHACRQAGVPLQELEAVAVDTGPGLFTGLRVAVAMANGLGLALRLPILGFESLEVLAASAATTWTGEVMVAVDARRGQVFFRRFTAANDGTVQPSGPARLASPRSTAACAAEVRGRLLAVGDGALRYRELLATLPHVRLGGPALASPDPAMLARMAARRGEGPWGLMPSRVVQPVYLREPDVRIGWPVRRSKGR